MHTKDGSSWYFVILSLIYITFTLKSSYDVDAKKNFANFSVVLDTPEYKRVSEVKNHISDVSLSSLHFRSI